MVIGDRLKALREQKEMSQGDIEKRTGLLRCYISRVENGHTVPAIETLEKLARALEVPLFHFFYEGENPPVARPQKSVDNGWGSQGRDARMLHRFCVALSRMENSDRQVLLSTALKMSRRVPHRSGKRNKDG